MKNYITSTKILKNYEEKKAKEKALEAANSKRQNVVSMVISQPIQMSWEQNFSFKFFKRINKFSIKKKKKNSSQQIFGKDFNCVKMRHMKEDCPELLGSFDQAKQSWGEENDSLVLCITIENNFNKVKEGRFCLWCWILSSVCKFVSFVRLVWCASLMENHSAYSKKY